MGVHLVTSEAMIWAHEVLLLARLPHLASRALVLVHIVTEVFALHVDKGQGLAVEMIARCIIFDAGSVNTCTTQCPIFGCWDWGTILPTNEVIALTAGHASNGALLHESFFVHIVVVFV